MRRWDSSWDYMKGRGATGGEEKGEISVFDLDPEQGLHLSEGRGEEGGRQENRRGRGRADSSCERFCRLNTNSTIVLHKLITGKQNADLYTNVRDYYFPAVSYFPHLDYFLSYWKAATDKSQSPAANPPDHTPTTDHKHLSTRFWGPKRRRERNRAESEDERAPTLQNTTEIVRNVSYVLPPSDSLSATSLLLSPPSPPSSLHPRLDSAQLFSLKRHSNDQSEKITPQREQLVKYPSSLSSLKHLSKGQ